MCSMWEFAPGQTQICAEENYSVGVEVVGGTFSFKFQTGVVGRIRQSSDLNVGKITHLNGRRFNSAAPSLFIYLVGAKSEEFSGNLSEIMILTHHKLPGLLKTKPVSANKQKNELHWWHSEVRAVPLNAARTWSISISWAFAPGHSIATFTMSDGGGMSA